MTDRRAAGREDEESRSIEVARVYDDPPQDGRCRVLVDCIWPRGITKDRLALDAWMKELAPSDELRAWFAHDPERWSEFLERYHAELRGLPERVADLWNTADGRPLLLLYGARETQFNNAVALRLYLLANGERA